jgi:hypothetical protein
VLVARYADHRRSIARRRSLARQGVIIIERSTLSFWMGYAAAEIALVVARLSKMMLASTRIFADETVMPDSIQAAGGLLLGDGTRYALDHWNGLERSSTTAC